METLCQDLSLSCPWPPARGDPCCLPMLLGCPSPAALSGFQTSQTPSLPCTLQAVRPLPLPTPCARGKATSALCCSGKASSSALPVLHLCPPAAYFTWAVTFRVASRDWERAARNKLKGLKKKCGLLNVPSSTCKTHFNPELQEQGWLWYCCDDQTIPSLDSKVKLNRFLPWKPS